MPSGRAGGPRPFAEADIVLTVKVPFTQLRFGGSEELAIEGVLKRADKEGKFETPVDFRGQVVTVEEKLSKQGEMEGGKIQGIDVSIWLGTPTLIRSDIPTFYQLVKSTVDDAGQLSGTVSFSKVAGPGGVARPFATTGFRMLVELSGPFYELIASMPTLEAEVRDETGVRTLDITSAEGVKGFTDEESDKFILVNPDAQSATVDYFDRIMRSIDENLTKGNAVNYLLMLNGGVDTDFREGIIRR